MKRNSTVESMIKAAYKIGRTDGENDMYNQEFVGEAKNNRPVKGEEEAVSQILKTLKAYK